MPCNGWPTRLRRAFLRRAGAAALGAAALVLPIGPAPIGAERAEALFDELATFARTRQVEVERIGRRIWRNEAAGREDWLIQWLPGEGHLSLGIGHVIWYPARARGPFHESFPDLVAFLRQSGVGLPAWLTPLGPCPWPSRAAFLASPADPRLSELGLERRCRFEIERSTAIS